MTSTKNSCIRDTDYSILPTHIITEILKHLTISDFKNATQVCKSWYYGSTDPYFIRKLCARITSKNFAPILDYNQRYYSKFIISDAYAANEVVVRNFLQHYQQYLQEIEFFYCANMNLDGILNLYVNHLPNLDTLTIKSRKNLFADTSSCISSNSMSNLKHFNFYTLSEFCDSDSVKNLYTFVCSIPNLTSLELHSKFDVIFDDFIEAFQKLPSLSNLKAISLHVVKHKNFVILVKNLVNIDFKNLLALRLYDAYHDSEEIVHGVGSFEYCDVIEKFCAKFLNLREFYVGYANDKILRNIFKFMKNLKILGLSCAHCIEFTEIDLFYVIEKLQINVYMQYNSFVGNDHLLESNVFKIFHNKFTNIKELKINGEIRQETLMCIAQNCPNLEVLHVSDLLKCYNEPHELYDKLTRLKILKINSSSINRKRE